MGGLVPRPRCNSGCACAGSPAYAPSSCDYTVDLVSRAFDDQAEFERLLARARDRRDIGGKPFIDFQLRRFGGGCRHGSEVVAAGHSPTRTPS